MYDGYSGPVWPSGVDWRTHAETPCITDVPDSILADPSVSVLIAGLPMSAKAEGTVTKVLTGADKSLTGTVTSGSCNSDRLGSNEGAIRLLAAANWAAPCSLGNACDPEVPIGLTATSGVRFRIWARKYRL